MKLRLFGSKTLSYKLVSIVLAIVLCTGFFGFMVSEVHAANYTISVSGSLFTCSDGYSNANANLVFSHAVGLATSGTTITFEAGTYTANSSSFEADNLDNVDFVFEAGSLLTIVNWLNVTVLKLVNCSSCTISGLTIDGNKPNEEQYWFSQGVELANCSGCLVTQSTINNCATYGYFDHDDNGNEPNNLTDSTLYLNGQNGVSIGQSWEPYTHGAFALNNDVAYDGDVGISVIGQQVTVENNTVHDMNGTEHLVSRWGIALEYNGTGNVTITRNNVTNCLNGIQLGSVGDQIGDNYVAYNIITDCTYGVIDCALGGNVITQNTITNTNQTVYEGNINAAILAGYTSGTVETENDIISFNTITSTLAFPFIFVNGAISINKANNITVINNTVTTNASDYSKGVEILNSSRTCIQGNNIQSNYGVTIDENSSSTRLNSNTLSNCSTQVDDSGTGTLQLTPDTRVTTEVFSDDFSDGTFDAWTSRSSGWGDAYPNATSGLGATYIAEMLHYSDRIVKTTEGNYSQFSLNFKLAWHTNPASGASNNPVQIQTIASQNILSLLTRNNGGSMEWGISFLNADPAIVTIYNSSSNPTIDTWYDVWMNITTGTSITVQIDGVTVLSNSSVLAGSNINYILAGQYTSDNSDQNIYFANFTISSTTGSAPVTTDSCVNVIDNPTMYGGSVSPVGSYQLDNSASTYQTVTLTANEYYTGKLNVDGANVTLTNNAYNVSTDGKYIHAIYAIFEQTSPTNYTIIIADDGHGSVNATSPYELADGTSFSLQATADTGYDFLNWVVSGIGNFTANPLPLTMNSTLDGKTVTAYFQAEAPAATTTPAPTYDGSLPTLNNDFLWTYLYSGDFLGFFQALFVASFGIVDLLYGLIAMLFLVPLYLRTKSLLLLSVLWILLGSFYIAMMPIVSGIAVLFVSLGIGGLFYRIFRGGNQ